jgi:D-psicose/D-tagatose/L-ribulose 3-epimerase
MSLNIKFGVSTWLWTSPFTTETAEPLFSKIAAMGFDAVEIAVEDPALIDATAVKKVLDKYGLQAIVCGAFGPTRDLTHEDPAIHQNCMQYIAQCLEFCEAWGSTFFAGPMYSAVGKARMVSPEQRKAEWNLAVQNLRIVCDMAAEKGLLIALEPLNRFESDLVNTAEDVCRLVDEINHPAARIMLDSFHSNIEEKDPEEAIRSIGNKFIHLQISENHRGIPGTGTTPWEAYRRGLEAIGYEGTVSIESFTPNNKELAAAVCIWHPLAPSEDQFATDGLRFMKAWAGAEKKLTTTTLSTSTNGI